MTRWQDMDTPTKIKAVRAIYVRGLAASKLAELIPGCGKNQIIGLYHRYASQFSDIPLRAPPVGPNNKGVKRSERKTSHPVWRKPRMAPVKPIPPQEYDATSLSLTLDQLDTGMCKWPTSRADEIGLTYFCGHEAQGSYCAQHKRRSVCAGTVGERTAHKVLAKELLR